VNRKPDQAISLTLACSLLLTLISAAGCGQARLTTTDATTATAESAASTTADTIEPLILDATATHILVKGDAMPQPTWISKQPQRVVILLGSLLELWYECGGSAIARVRNVAHLPPEAADLPILGTIATINIELLIELQPDLVISPELALLDKLQPILAANQIPTLTLRYRHYQHFRQIYELFCHMTGRLDLLESTLAPIEAQIAQIQAWCHGRPAPRTVVLFSTPNSVSCETRNSSAGTMLEMLGADNLSSLYGLDGAMRSEFSLEWLIASAPEVVLINTMGDTQACRQRAQRVFLDNPAWATTPAAQNGRVHFLDKDLFMYKPNSRYPQAFAQLADLLYPPPLGANAGNRAQQALAESIDHGH